MIGAGHAGLAMSNELTRLGIDHVVLERGEVANTWRTERWDSLRLLTPNWQSRLPGLSYTGTDPDGFMTMGEVIQLIERYSVVIDAPVLTGTPVDAVRPHSDGFAVVANEEVWLCAAVVLATGGFNLPRLPALARDLPSHLESISSFEYRRPGDLPDAPVLVVGASSTGIQIGEEVHRSGRPVTIAVGEHVRMPRRYRERDIQWWMDRSGVLDERYDEVGDIVRARHVPSPQLVGTIERSTLDLNVLRSQGVRLVGRLVSIEGATASFSGSLRNVCGLADLKLARLLDMIDEYAGVSGLEDVVGSPHRFEPTIIDQEPTLNIPLSGYGTVVWATGYRADYSWLEVPALDRRGEIRHDGGVVVDWPGLYRIGLNFLRRRKSSFIHGAGDDAGDLAGHLDNYLKSRARPMASARRRA